jgi:hypothetical protein
VKLTFGCLLQKILVGVIARHEGTHHLIPPLLHLCHLTQLYPFTCPVGIILADPNRHLGPADPDPDRSFQFQPNVLLNYAFSTKSQSTVKDIENYDTYL